MKVRSFFVGETVPNVVRKQTCTLLIRVGEFNLYSQFHQLFSSSFCKFSFAKKLQTQTLRTEKLPQTISYENTARNMSVKLTSGMNENHFEVFLRSIVHTSFHNSARVSV